MNNSCRRAGQRDVTAGVSLPRSAQSWPASSRQYQDARQGGPDDDQSHRGSGGGTAAHQTRSDRKGENGKTARLNDWQRCWWARRRRRSRRRLSASRSAVRSTFETRQDDRLLVVCQRKHWPSCVEVQCTAQTEMINIQNFCSIAHRVR